MDVAPRYEIDKVTGRADMTSIFDVLTNSTLLSWARSACACSSAMVGGALALGRAGRAGAAFTASALAVAFVLAMLFAWTFSNAMPSTGPGPDLSLAAASASPSS